MSNENGSQALGYARAVYELALESWQKNLLAVNEKLANNPDLLASLNNTQTPFAERQKQLDGLLAADVSQKIRNFFYIILKDGNLDLLNEIATNLLRLATKGPEFDVASVTTAISLTESEKQAFQNKLAAKYGADLEIDFKIDKTILGGVIVQVGDKILDGSLTTKLNAARDSLLAS